MKDFIRNPKLLEETVSEKDYFDFSDYITSFSQKIDKFNQSSMIGIVADYGRGKSTLIKQVEKSRLNENETWVQFDAWKTPERKELWETFVIDLARQINDKEFRKAILKIDGKQNDDKRALFNTLSDIPMLSVVKNINYFFESSPARRIFEIQEVLKDIIKQFPGDRLIIVIEDVDRSGEQGIFFIETLKQFIKEAENELEKQLIVILPISEDSFFDKEESYLKSLDIIDFFKTKELDYKDFFRDVLVNELTSNEKLIKQVSDFFILLSREYSNTTMRKVKLILRRARILYQLLEQDSYEPDWRMCIVAESARFFKNKKNKNEFQYESMLDLFIRDGRIDGNSIFGSFLYAISNIGSYYQLIDNYGKKTNDKISSFNFVTRPSNEEVNIKNFPSIPHYSGDNNSGYFVTDFYFNK